MGTYRAVFSIFSTAGLTESDGTYSPLGTFYIRQASLSGVAIYTLTGQCFYLDGEAIPVSMFQLPSGFLPLTAGLRRVGLGAIGEVRIGHINSTSEAVIEYGTYTSTSDAPFTGVLYPISAPSLTGPIPSLIDLIKFLRVEYTTVANGGFDASLIGFAYPEVEVWGTYDIFAFTQPIIDGVHVSPSVTLNPRSFVMGHGGSGSIIRPNQIPPGSLSPGYDFPPVIGPGMTYVSPTDANVAGKIYPGDLIRIESTDIDLTEVTELALSYTDELGNIQRFIIFIQFIFYQSPTLIIFKVPPYIAKVWEDEPTTPDYPDIPIIPVITIVGTTFSGTVELNPIVISIADASGIYFLSEGKINDTLYDNVNPPDTVDVKIPDPFIKTGFIGG